MTIDIVASLGLPEPKSFRAMALERASLKQTKADASPSVPILVSVPPGSEGAALVEALQSHGSAWPSGPDHAGARAAQAAALSVIVAAVAQYRQCEVGHDG